MIPKIIHYCWFSDDPYPDLVKRCIRSWKLILPDYELRLWDGNSSPETPQWYTIEWFHNLFLNHFDLLHIQETETNRVLFLGTIKQ